LEVDICFHTLPVPAEYRKAVAAESQTPFLPPFRDCTTLQPDPRFYFHTARWWTVRLYTPNAKLTLVVLVAQQRASRLDLSN
jgi:hypothetical protein